MRGLRSSLGWILGAALALTVGSAVVDRLDVASISHARLMPFVRLIAQPLSSANPFAYWVKPGDCSGTTANATGTNGLTVVGASNKNVIQVQSTNVGTNTHIYACEIAPPSFIVSATTGLAVVDAVFAYGVQTTGLGTQAAVLASGTMNAVQVFNTITYPAAGAGETPSTVTPVRGDTGTLVITPAVASANVATTTAGAFVTTTFTPATAIPVSTDFKDLMLQVGLLNTATSATITNSPGVLVHFRSQ
jgi:hypothetical protein